jgi:hypothetical protein
MAADRVIGDFQGWRVFLGRTGEPYRAKSPDRFDPRGARDIGATVREKP